MDRRLIRTRTVACVTAVAAHDCGLRCSRTARAGCRQPTRCPLRVDAGRAAPDRTIDDNPRHAGHSNEALASPRRTAQHGHPVLSRRMIRHVEPSRYGYAAREVLLAAPDAALSPPESELVMAEAGRARPKAQLTESAVWCVQRANSRSSHDGVSIDRPSDRRSCGEPRNGRFGLVSASTVPARRRLSLVRRPCRRHRT